MENLIEKIAAYKITTQKLLNKVNDYTDYVKEHIPFEFWGNFSLKRYHNANIDTWDITIPVFIPELGQEERKAVPANMEDLGKYGKWCECQYTTGKELITWAKKLPELIKKAEEYIKQLTTEAEKI